jgi:hypothetical protein
MCKWGKRKGNEWGIHPFHTVITPAEEICAGSTVSQHLAEAYMRNSAPARTKILSWAADFSDIINRVSFGSLPERQTWDHTIEIVPDTKLANCKVYLISLL